MRARARTDANQAAIVDLLRRVGAQVQHLHQVGGGCPDLLVQFRGVLYLLEVKAPTGRLTKDEALWMEQWGSPVHVVYSGDEALQAIGAKVRL